MTGERLDGEPIHPGRLISEEILPFLGVGSSRLAKTLGISRQMLHKVISGTNGITPDMAVLLGRLCGSGPHLWMRLQAAHDIWHARSKLADRLETIPCHDIPLSRR